MNIRIIDKEEDPLPSSDRVGSRYELYLELINLMKNEPGKKAVVTFTSKQTGLRWQDKMAAWAESDGYQLFASAVAGTKDRQMYLEAKAEPNE